MSNHRSTVIENLLKFSQPLDYLEKQLKGFGWDFERDPIVLSRHHIADILRRYLNGELTASMVERWANMVEGREDITFDNKYEKWIDDTIYELANPFLTTPLGTKRAQELIAQGYGS